MVASQLLPVMADAACDRGTSATRDMPSHTDVSVALLQTHSQVSSSFVALIVRDVIDQYIATYIMRLRGGYVCFQVVRAASASVRMYQTLVSSYGSQSAS